jgi:hypothetical protein
MIHPGKPFHETFVVKDKMNTVSGKKQSTGRTPVYGRFLAQFYAV